MSPSAEVSNSIRGIGSARASVRRVRSPPATNGWSTTQRRGFFNRLASGPPRSAGSHSGLCPRSGSRPRGSSACRPRRRAFPARSRATRSCDLYQLALETGLLQAAIAIVVLAPDREVVVLPHPELPFAVAAVGRLALGGRHRFDHMALVAVDDLGAEHLVLVGLEVFRLHVRIGEGRPHAAVALAAGGEPLDVCRRRQIEPLVVVSAKAAAAHRRPPAFGAPPMGCSRSFRSVMT